jgi:hypothetical protein
MSLIRWIGGDIALGDGHFSIEKLSGRVRTSDAISSPTISLEELEDFLMNSNSRAIIFRMILLVSNERKCSRCQAQECHKCKIAV